MLEIMLKQVMREKGLSSRKAAAAIGVAHATVLRVLKGEAVDIETLVKFANFLEVRPSELLNSMTTDATLPEQLAALLSHSPELEATLKDAVERVRAGEIKPATITDIVSYALYKLNQPGA